MEGSHGPSVAFVASRGSASSGDDEEPSRRLTARQVWISELGADTGGLGALVSILGRSIARRTPRCSTESPVRHGAELVREGGLDPRRIDRTFHLLIVLLPVLAALSRPQEDRSHVSREHHTSLSDYGDLESRP